MAIVLVERSSGKPPTACCIAFRTNADFAVLSTIAELPGRDYHQAACSDLCNRLQLNPCFRQSLGTSR